MKTREEYLTKAAAALLKGHFRARGVTPIKANAFQVSCGWATKARAIGQFFPTGLSRAGTAQIFISPVLDSPVEALAVLVHELIHYCDNGESKHRGFFKKAAKDVGLVGKLTATEAGDDLKVVLAALAAKLGEYPHAALDRGARKVQPTRLLKFECGECGFIMRTTQKWVDQMSIKSVCPVCEERTLVIA